MKYVMLILVLLVGCGKQQSDNDTKLSFVFYDGNIQKIFIEKLKEDNVKFDIENKTVWYSIKDSYKVERLKKEILKDHYTNPYSLSISDKNDKKKVLAELDKQDVSYEIRETSSKTWIIWDKDNDEKVRDILVNNNIMILEYRDKMK